jgi:hypothetical protein
MVLTGAQGIVVVCYPWWNGRVMNWSVRQMTVAVASLWSGARPKLFLHPIAVMCFVHADWLGAGHARRPVDQQGRGATA